MSSVAQLLKNGNPYVISVTFEGVPYVWCEMVPERVDYASSPGVATGYVGAVPALLIKDSDSIGIELDRVSGVSRGGAIDIRLSHDAIEEAGLRGYFARPTARAHVTGDHAHDAVTITVDSAAGFSASGTLNLGRELISYSSIVGNQFLGCTRKVLGNGYNVKGNSPTYRTVTQPSPMHWRGRFVTMRLHMLSKEERMLDANWHGTDYSVTLWHGFVDEQPRAEDHCLTFRCLPLVRMAGRPLGTSQTFKVASFSRQMTVHLSLRRRERHRSTLVQIPGLRSLSSTSNYPPRPYTPRASLPTRLPWGSELSTNGLKILPAC